MERKIINASAAPAPIGPYNQAVQAGNLLFISGQIPMDATTGELVTAGIKEATEKVMENIKEILTEAGMSFENIVKTTIFLTDMQQFSEVNEVYGAHFNDAAPARETVQVAALPKGVSVEISAIAAQ